MESDQGRSAGGGRRLAYRIVAAVLGLATIVLSVPFTISSFVNEEDEIHRMHNVAGLIGFAGLIGVLLLVTAWKPEQHIVSFRVAAAAAIAGAVAGLLSSDFFSGGWYFAPVGLAILSVLHPARGELLRSRVPNLPAALLSIASLLPGGAWALTQAKLQRNGVPSVDPHAEFHHYSAMAAAGLTIGLVGLAAAFEGAGQRFAGWFVGVSVAVLGGASLALSDHVGAFDTGWSWAMIVGGAVYAALIEMGARRPVTA
jgi:hypothetical protein